MSTLLLHKLHADAEASEDGAEARMRQALGKLGTAKPGKLNAPRHGTYQAKPGGGRHRFKRDGEVPVVQLTLTEGARSGERQARMPISGTESSHGPAGEARVRSGTESARQELVLTEQLRATQTRLGHVELTLSEAIRTAQVQQEEAAGLRQALDTTKATLAQVRAELAASKRAHGELEQRQAMTQHSKPKAREQDDITVRRRVGRPLGSTNRTRDQRPASEPVPVKWWAGD